MPHGLEASPKLPASPPMSPGPRTYLSAAPARITATMSAATSGVGIREERCEGDPARVRVEPHRAVGEANACRGTIGAAVPSDDIVAAGRLQVHESPVCTARGCASSPAAGPPAALARFGGRALEPRRRHRRVGRRTSRSDASHTGTDHGSLDARAHVPLARRRTGSRRATVRRTNRPDPISCLNVVRPSLNPTRRSAEITTMSSPIATDWITDLDGAVEHDPLVRRVQRAARAGDWYAAQAAATIAIASGRRSEVA